MIENKIKENENQELNYSDFNKNKDDFKKKRKKEGFFKKILPFALIVFSVISFNLFIGRVGTTVGESMMPTLNDGSLFYVNLRTEPERNDVIVFEHQGSYLIKRIIGLPGEKIQIKENIIYINGEPIEDKIKLNMIDYGIVAEEIQLKEDEFFVMGDNRNNSADSREIGPIKKDSIMGVVSHSLNPFKSLV